MGRLNQLLSRAEPHFDEGEEALAAVLGQFETKRAGADALKTGVMIATDRRVLFYAKRLFGYQLEHFPYRGISSFEQGRRMMGFYIKFFASGNEVSLKWIAEGDVESFAATVRKGMAEGTATRVVPKEGSATGRSSKQTPWGSVVGVVVVLAIVAGCAGFFTWVMDNHAPSPQRLRQSTTPRTTEPTHAVGGPAKFLQAMQDHGFEVEEVWHQTLGEPKWWTGTAHQYLDVLAEDRKPQSQLVLTIHSDTRDRIRIAMLHGIVMAPEDQDEVQAVMAKAAPVMLEELGVALPAMLRDAIEGGTPMTSEMANGTVSLEVQSDPTAFVLSIKDIK